MKRKLIIQIQSLISSGCGEIIDLTSPGSSQIIEMTSYNTDLLCTWLIKVKLTSIPQLQIRSLARIQNFAFILFTYVILFKDSHWYNYQSYGGVSWPSIQYKQQLLSLPDFQGLSDWRTGKTVRHISYSPYTRARLFVYKYFESFDLKKTTSEIITDNSFYLTKF